MTADSQNHEEPVRIENGRSFTLDELVSVVNNFNEKLNNKETK